MIYVYIVPIPLIFILHLKGLPLTPICQQRCDLGKRSKGTKTENYVNWVFEIKDPSPGTCFYAMERADFG